MTDRTRSAAAHLLALPTPPVRIAGDGQASALPLSALCDDSRRAAPGAMFVCIRGLHSDGHHYLGAAYAAGCRLFLVEHRPDEPLPPDADVYLSDNTRRDLAHLATAYYGHPSRAMAVVGITGTKGKTTTALMCHHLCRRAGIASGYIGTSGIQFGTVCRPTANTTPAPLMLQATLAEMAQNGVRAVFIEISSQALMQERVAGMTFAAAALTNLSPDHIGEGEHPDFAHYAASKRRLLTEYAPPVVVAWGDDPHSPEMLRDLPGRLVRCGTAASDEVRLTSLVPTLEHGLPGIAFTLCRGGQATSVRLPLPGAHNAANAALALTLLSQLGIAADAADLEDISLPSRYEVLPFRGALIVIDYAHNGASLQASLDSLRPYAKGRLLCLLGSVGERSRGRRAELGRVVSEMADFAYLTALEPNFEPVEDICAEIAAAFPPSFPHVVIPDRVRAIHRALEDLATGDVLLICGKGDDREMLVRGKMIPHNDRQVVEDVLREHAVLPLA